MELKIDELRETGRPLGTADLTGGGGDIYSDRVAVGGGRIAGEEVKEELDPIDIEILLTSGHYDDCCIS